MNSDKKKHVTTSKANFFASEIAHQDISCKPQGEESTSRRLFLRSVGIGSAGLLLSKVGFSKGYGIQELTGYAPFADGQKHYYGHDAVLDKFGVISPWYKEPNGQCDFRVRVAAETLKRYPWTTPDNAIAVYPDYLFTSKWKISPDGTIAPQNPGNWMNGDLGQRSTSVLKGMVEYYRYSGDPAAIAHLTYMGDHLIDNCLTPDDHPWPRFPISVPTLGKPYGKADPKGMIQLDICGSMGQGLLRAYQVTQNERWFEYAKHWGDVFAEKCNSDPNAAPWPRYAVHESALVAFPKWKKEDPRTNTQTGGVTMILAFLDELIRLGYTGKNNHIITARDAGLRYLNSLLADWTKNENLGYFFWDWLNDVQNCSTTADVTGYIMNNKARFPNWANDVRNILTVFYNRSSVNIASRGDVYSGAWAYPESRSCCTRSLWYAPLMDGSVLAQYAAEADSTWARELAYRQMVLQTYDAAENGVTEDNIDGGVIVNGTWLNIAHPWPLLWVLNAISWLPEELGASRENHLVRSNSVVNSITYSKGSITYSTFDAPLNTVDVLRLSFKPKTITADGHKLCHIKKLKGNGYSIKKLPNGDTIVHIRHDGARNIVVRGTDQQAILENKTLSYKGAWTQQKDTSSLSGLIYATDIPGASVTATFQGNQVRVTARADMFGGLADVFIDGEKQLVPIDFWNPATRNQQILYYKNGLKQGSHTLEIVARGTGNHYAKGNRVYIDSIQFSAEGNSFNFPTGTGPTEPQRMVFGYTKRQDYKDANGRLWRPGTEVVTRLASNGDPVKLCWLTDPGENVTNTPDPELYRYGYQASEFWINITVGPGKYDVKLKFASNRGFDTRKNSFDIFINGEKVVNKLDITATAGGVNKAADLIFKNIPPTNGIIEVRFKANDIKDGKAFVQALEVGQNLGGAGAIPVSA